MFGKIILDIPRPDLANSGLALFLGLLNNSVTNKIIDNQLYIFETSLSVVKTNTFAQRFGIVFDYCFESVLINSIVPVSHLLKHMRSNLFFLCTLNCWTSNIS
ncbi:hypothetical protein BpHYR1_015457 [Brachionus plicatilis]|uniref:Uncharacterized protein n=1 Tax=Brachionus plicatilis TaxID=10195 RepID=A0A3M7PU20_BRAPC|nr:hypothetical protein BpHYR1_015457 [Brachionus plicatilis]